MKKSLIRLPFLCLAMILLFIQCKNAEDKNSTDSETEDNKTANTEMKIEKSEFGKTSEGDSVQKYTISNAEGFRMSVINYGGIITELKVPNKSGEYEDVVLGLDSVSQYETAGTYFGAIIGRYGNRIAKGKFSLDGTEYTLETNNGENHLHGGEKGFDKVIWNIEPQTNGDEASLKMTYTSKDGEGGYPGELKTTVIYTVNADNDLNVKYEATTDKKTIVNLTQHSYFNLTGDFSNKILDHIVRIDADEYLPVDDGLIPTGELRAVKGTPFDFSQPTPISVGMEEEKTNEQLKKGPGFDHCWILNQQNTGMQFAASVYEPQSGRYMEVYTTEPAIQMYVGNFLDGSLPAQGGGNYEQRTGFCLETQHYPDSPNQEKFPSTVLNPGETYTSQTTYKFSTK